MTEKCALCQTDLNPYDVGVSREVKGWVSGPKRDHMRLREETGRYAHERCVKNLSDGQAVDQPSLLDDVESERKTTILPELPDYALELLNEEEGL